jgi:hypothetical protein
MGMSVGGVLSVSRNLSSRDAKRASGQGGGFRMELRRGRRRDQKGRFDRVVNEEDGAGGSKGDQWNGLE